ncbi:hypothetical protein [Nocardioides sp.]|uniref:hypothetical protein n=1 Tax=Nocardioides sp. TaxID=35761 RepID=UPI0039E66929
MTGRFLRLEEDEFTDEEGRQVPYMSLVVDDGDQQLRVSVPREARGEARKHFAEVDYGQEVSVGVRVGLRRANEFRPASVTYRLLSVSPALAGA